MRLNRDEFKRNCNCIAIKNLFLLLHTYIDEIYVSLLMDRSSSETISTHFSFTKNHRSVLLLTSEVTTTNHSYWYWYITVKLCLQNFEHNKSLWLLIQCSCSYTSDFYRRINVGLLPFFLLSGFTYYFQRKIFEIIRVVQKFN